MWTWISSLSLAFGTCNWAQAKRETFAECSTALNLAHSLRRGYKSWCRWSDRSVLVISSVAGMDTKRAIAHTPPLSSYKDAATSFSADKAYIVHCLMSWRERGSMPVARQPDSRGNQRVKKRAYCSITARKGSYDIRECAMAVTGKVLTALCSGERIHTCSAEARIGGPNQATSSCGAPQVCFQ